MLEVVALARGFLGQEGRIERMWTAGGIGDQPADLWEVVEAVSSAVRTYLAKLRK